MTIVKICGLSSPEHLLVAAAAGADYVGLVFAPSRRQVSLSTAQRLVATLRDAGYATQVVGLFVNESAATIAATVATCGLDVVQLHGTEGYDIVAELPVMPIWRALRLNGSADEAAWLTSSDARITTLVDAPITATQFGGTGESADWAAATALARQRHIVLAGGLTPGNVRAAIHQVSPWGVDVSSGVERAGYKDNGLIAAFIDLAKSTSEVV
jgi:phosphoribosylanthranilate isomerase